MSLPRAFVLAAVGLVATASPSYAQAWLNQSTGPQVFLPGEMNGVPVALQLEHFNENVWIELVATGIPSEFEATSLASGYQDADLSFKVVMDAKDFAAGMPPQEVAVTYWLPNCERAATGKASFSLEGSTFSLSAKSLKLHPVACEDVAKREYRLKTSFGGFGDEQVAALGLITPDAYASCDLRSLGHYEQSELIGMRARVYGDGDMGVISELARTDPFWTMGFAGREQTGDTKWDVNEDVLWYGDEVEVVGTHLWEPGMHYTNRKLVEVRRVSDGEVTILSGFNLYTGDASACDPRLLLSESILPGIWVKVKPDVTLSDANGRWFTDPELEYGYCKNAIGNDKVDCQTRAYTASPNYKHNFTAKWADIDLVTALPSPAD